MGGQDGYSRDLLDYNEELRPPLRRAGHLGPMRALGA